MDNKIVFIWSTLIHSFLHVCLECGVHLLDSQFEYKSARGMATSKGTASGLTHSLSLDATNLRQMDKAWITGLIWS